MTTFIHIILPMLLLIAACAIGYRKEDLNYKGDDGH